MIKRHLTIISLFVGAIVLMVSNGWCGSPYSANAIGTIIPDDIGRSRGMGGAGIANGDGMNLLRDNPALLNTFDKFSFSYEAFYNQTKTYIHDEESSTYGKINPNMIKIVLPVANNFVLGWGLSPYSRTDINILIPNVQNGVQINDTISSFGGVNVSSAVIAGSYRNIIHFGFSLNYNFGMIQEDWERTFPENNELNGSIYHIKRKYKGYGGTIGILANVYKNTSIGLGYTSKSDMNNNTYIISGSITNPEKLLSTKKAFLPASWRIGISSELRERLKAVMDFKFVQWENTAREPKEKEMYNNTYSFGAGIRYIPSNRPNSLYLKKIPLSIGFKFGTLFYKSYPKINTVFEKAITLGVEIPLKEDIGTIITSFEYGTRGDKAKNGWDETFTGVGVSLIGKIK